MIAPLHDMQMGSEELDRLIEEQAMDMLDVALMGHELPRYGERELTFDERLRLGFGLANMNDED